MRKLFVVCLLSVLAIGCEEKASAPASDGGSTAESAASAPAGAVAERVNGARARELVAAGAVLLDVRSPAEFSRGHVEGARNIPVQELASKIKEVGAFEDPVVIYCQSGIRSATAMRMLEGAGYTKLYDLGSMSSW